MTHKIKMIESICRTWVMYLANVDFSILVVVISFHEALLQFGQHGVRYDLEREKEKTKASIIEERETLQNVM